MNKTLRSFRRETRADTVAECNLILIEHLDRRVPFESSPSHSRRRGHVRQLVGWGFLELDGNETVITDLGRLSLAETLAQLADTLTAYKRKRKTRRNLRLAARSLEPAMPMDSGRSPQIPEMLQETSTSFSQKLVDDFRE